MPRVLQLHAWFLYDRRYDVCRGSCSEFPSVDGAGLGGEIVADTPDT
jgi:hypothetical protein